jgi:ADP-ribose pyrophosphatase YjhB (NUDIX family)
MEDKDKHFLGNVAQKAIIERDGKILVCRGIGDKVWELPGGRLHTEEVPAEGIAREIREELGLEIKDIKPFRVERSFHYKSNAYQVLIAYTCTCDSTDIQVDATELEEIKWVSKEELQTLPMFDTFDAIKVALLDR